MDKGESLTSLGVLGISRWPAVGHGAAAGDGCGGGGGSGNAMGKYSKGEIGTAPMTNSQPCASIPASNTHTRTHMRNAAGDGQV